MGIFRWNWSGVFGEDNDWIRKKAGIRLTNGRQ